MAAARSARFYIMAALALAAIVLVGAVALSLMSSGGEGGDGRGGAVFAVGGDAEPQFVGAASCQQCHEVEHEAWHGSHHDMAMRLPSRRTVRGDFDDARFTQHEITHRFYRDGGDYYVHTEGPDGEMGDYRIAYTFGVEPLQQYLIEFDNGRFQTLPLAWDTQRERWFHVYGEQRIPPGDELYWTGRLQNWNYMCASCHSTDLQKNYDVEDDAYHTLYAEMNVSCEACHGPGSEHVAWAEASWLGRLWMDGDTAEQKGLVLDMGEAASGAEREVSIEAVAQRDRRGQMAEMAACLPCHTRRQEIGADYTHGNAFFDHFMPELLEEDVFYADGQIQDEVFEGASFMQSRMYQAGVRCTDCHEPHSLELRATGNQLCIRCHEPQQYDTPAHHFHAPGEQGSSCVECHMPTRDYMQVDGRRDHGFRVPRPDLTAKLGPDAVPNTCNSCHEDRSAEWAADTVAQWHGEDRKHQGFHYAEAIHAGRQREPDAPQLLQRVVNDESEPAIVRATAVDLLGRYAGPEQIAAIEQALADGAPVVRAAAAGATAGIEPQRRAQLLQPLLSDERRAVRVEAARVMATGPSSPLEPGQAEVFNRALAEYKRSQKALMDQPGACLNLAVVYEHEGKLDKAAWAYQHALRVDSGFHPARMNLAMLHHQQGRNDDAERLLRQVIEEADQTGEAYYSLGLLLAEENRLEEAADALAEAAAELEDRSRVQYNAAIAHQQLDDAAAAERYYLKAASLEPNSADILNAVAIFYLQQGHYDRARQYAQRLAQLYPQAPQPRRLLQEIDRRAQQAE